MGQAKDAADKPAGNGPTRAYEKSHTKPDNNQFKIDFCWHLRSPPSETARTKLPRKAFSINS